MKRINGCRIIIPQKCFQGKQGLFYQAGISKTTVGSEHLHMQLASIPAMSQGRAHKHMSHETAIYALSGTSWVRFGEQLENELEVPEGAFLYIPAGVAHLPFNRSGQKAVVVISRTDANEQESVVMLPELNSYFLLS